MKKKLRNLATNSAPKIYISKGIIYTFFAAHVINGLLDIRDAMLMELSELFVSGVKIK